MFVSNNNSCSPGSVNPEELVQDKALRILVALSFDATRSTLSETPGFLQSLVGLLANTHARPTIREYVSTILINLAKDNSANRTIILNLGAVPAIVSALRGGGGNRTQGIAAEVLAAYALDPSGRQAIRDAGVIPILVDIVLSSTTNNRSGNGSASHLLSLQQHAAMCISSLAMEERDAEQINNLGGLLGMVNLLSSPNPVLQYAAVLAIANLSRNLICRESIVASEGLPILASLLGASSQKSIGGSGSAGSEKDDEDLILEQLILALYHLSFSPSMQDRLEMDRILDPVLALLLFASPATSASSFTIDPKTREILITLLLNLSMNNHKGNWDKLVRKGGIPVLLIFASAQNGIAQKLAAREISRRAEDDQFRRELLLTDNGQALSSLIHIFLSSDAELQEAALGSIAYISSDPNCCHEILQFGCLDNVLKFLSRHSSGARVGGSHSAPEHQSHAAMVVANISKNPENLSLVPLTDAIGALVDLMFSSHESLQCSVLLALANISVIPQSAQLVFQFGGLLAFVTLMTATSPIIREISTTALFRLAHHPFCRESLLTDETFISRLPTLLQHHPQLQPSGAGTTGAFLSTEYTNNSTIVSTGLSLVSLLTEDSRFCRIAGTANLVGPLISFLSSAFDSPPSSSPESEEGQQDSATTDISSDNILVLLRSLVSIAASNLTSRRAMIEARVLGPLQTIIHFISANKNSPLVPRSCQVLATELLAHLLRDTRNKTSVREAGMVPTLVQLCNFTTTDLATTTLQADQTPLQGSLIQSLLLLAMDKTNRRILSEEDGVGCSVSLLSTSTNDVVVGNALGLLESLLYDSVNDHQNQSSFLKRGGLNVVTSLLALEGSTLQLHALHVIHFLSCSETNAVILGQCGILESLLRVVIPSPSPPSSSSPSPVSDVRLQMVLQSVDLLLLAEENRAILSLLLTRDLMLEQAVRSLTATNLPFARSLTDLLCLL
jgi:hypothetical protein